MNQQEPIPGRLSPENRRALMELDRFCIRCVVVLAVTAVLVTGLLRVARWLGGLGL